MKRVILTIVGLLLLSSVCVAQPAVYPLSPQEEDTIANLQREVEAHRVGLDRASHKLREAKDAIIFKHTKDPVYNPNREFWQQPLYKYEITEDGKFLVKTNN